MLIQKVSDNFMSVCFIQRSILYDMVVMYMLEDSLR